MRGGYEVSPHVEPPGAWTPLNRPAPSPSAMAPRSVPEPRTGSRHLRRNLGDVKQMLTVGSRRRAGAVDITVQWIKTSWTKQSRGGEAAARRNAAPVGFSLPQVPSGFAHFVQISERGGFEPRSSQKDLREIGVSLRDEGDRLRVLARVEPFFGLPPRPRRPPAVRLLPRQWVRWQAPWGSAAGRTGSTRSTSLMAPSTGTSSCQSRP